MRGSSAGSHSGSGRSHGSSRSHGSGHHHRSRTARRRKRTRRIITWSLVGLAALVVFSVAWVGIRALLAKNELEAAVPLARLAQEQILDGDAAAASKTARDLADHAASAAALTGDLIWRVYEAIPGLGPNLEVLRSISASVDRAASGAVLPLAAAAEGMDLARFAPAGNRIDLQPIVDLQEPAHQARVAMDTAAAMVESPRVAAADVIGPLADARDEYVELIGQARDVVGGLDRATTLLPPMLGAAGPRDILLLFQNNAELRSLGGIPGALALVHADGGGIGLVQQASSSDFPRFDPPVVQLPVETRALWGDNTARYIQDATFTPQFPLAATVAREMWRQRFGQEVQTVVAVDPVMLSYLLRATGPLTLSTGDIVTADNAVTFLLQDVYLRYEVSQQDAIFAEVASAAFDALAAGGADPRALIDAFAQAGAERRILIWNADVTEQAVLHGTTLDGALPEGDPEEQAFGVYFNDATGSKMDRFLQVAIESGTVTCRNDGLPLYEIHVTVTNTAPADAATSLPRYVTGGGDYGTPPGSITTTVHVYSELGTYNLGVKLNGEPTGYHPTSDSGYTLSKVVSTLAPGESAAYTFGFLGGESGMKTPIIEATPLMVPLEPTGASLSCDTAEWAALR
ncbi:DUF4012 domain-containing protein [Agromyces intestinalis]|uniref:DUF4012 domain-containing protein n=1 Tax=Agromyces intestinalis TaxID=2592652 RepID=A0A5C1YE03_9MICO|nr:DUF4012 domain-containing protein [Agromyces intestinalis]QEO13665.1 DUF4012 domain-containing protein [Agromyces intestinalis]